ncbi:LysR substrate-binding domain-containing protein [Sphingomonas hankookensis]|uniref:LysR substrate-binding domain-containing protein n=1 Tax=Sphingomonas hankookensis TaxID=563996 RepID=UPI001F55D0E5|nr:LysR substrate-binding domain-containing protein [Sphingomonas hankookensis]
MRGSDDIKGMVSGWCVTLATGVALGAFAFPSMAQTVSPTAQPVASGQATGGAKLDRARVDALLAAPSGVVFVDVRRADEISAIGGLPAYLSIPLSDLERLSGFIPRERQVVTVSNHAARALKAAALSAGQSAELLRHAARVRLVRARSDRRHCAGTWRVCRRPCRPSVHHGQRRARRQRMAVWRPRQKIVEMVPRLIVNGIDAIVAAAEAGVGLANVLSYQSAAHIADGRLVEVLADHAPSAVPVSLLYDPGRATMPAVRVFIDAMREQGRQGAFAG